MTRSSTNLVVLLIAWTIIFSLVPLVSGIFTYNESKPSFTKPTIWNYFTYDDGTVVIHILSVNPYHDLGLNVTKCYNSTLSLRVIYPNGTVGEIDSDLGGIQDFNWCLTKYGSYSIRNPIRVTNLHSGYAVVTYINASDPNDYLTYKEWGLIMGLDGKIHDRAYLGLPYLDLKKGFWRRSSIVENVNPERGFFRVSWKDLIYEWQQYIIDDNNNFKMFLNGSFKKIDNFDVHLIISNVDEGYNIIMQNKTTDLTPTKDPFTVRAGAYVLLKKYDDTQFSPPILLYQLTRDDFNLSYLECEISNVKVGQVCRIALDDSNSTYYSKFYYLSTGSIVEFSPITLPDIPEKNFTFLDFNSFVFYSIPLGGYFYPSFLFNESSNITYTYGYIFDSNANNPTNWSLPEPSVIDSMGTFIILPNNTMLLAQPELIDSWSFISIDLPKFTEDHGYLNTFINTTYPQIDSVIPTSTEKITITFYQPVEFSAGNISIYQVENNVDILRQYVSGLRNSDYCTISDNGLIITIKVIKSTFSKPLGKFYIKFDGNFVRDKTYKESLRGLYTNIWQFSTSKNLEQFADSATGLMRLTTEGTQHYENLTSTEKHQFFLNLQNELSKIIPINIDKLSSTEKTQVDNTNGRRQLIISIDIKSSKDERSVDAIVKDLDEMIKYKSMTLISLNPTTIFLDENYGFATTPNLWEKYKFKLLGLFLAIIFLIIIFFIAQRREKKANNTAILQLGLIIFDLALDILFVVFNGKIVEELYIPSIVFLVVPITLNTIWAFYIIKAENASPEFLGWFNQNIKTASIFTILSGADIEALSILYSNFAGFAHFQAPFSHKGKVRIFRASFLAVFTENIPQVVIQIIYHFLVISYDIVPLLTLISSCLSLTINLIGRIYQAISYSRFHHESSENNTNKNKNKEEVEDDKSTQDFSNINFIPEIPITLANVSQ
ncbi:5412_t:CDS:2 [Diversispora eburnea]|uniref:5412_t:CDS:1 n=1 Tax=Diversispora eburnea TaxID=1213867 RepID=A0A9N9ANQ3_9GLOM|nr:5412_t:CDS:2 [Diversispora eburnea]